MPDQARGSANSLAISRFSLLANFLPMVCIVALVALSLVLADSAGARLALFIGLLYLAPPVCARSLTWAFNKPTGRDLTQSSRAFKVWWILLQLQMPFNRLPWLEELLRLIPGLYPLWLNLWGAQVHPATFWAPGARIIDRPYVQTGYGSVVGTEALLSGHLARTESNRFVVDIAVIVIGAQAVIGARCSIGPGCVVGPRETLAATTRLAPFNRFVDGKRQ